MSKSPKRIQGTRGRQESNLQTFGFVDRCSIPSSYTHRTIPGNEKAARSSTAEVGGVGTDLAALTAPPLQITTGFAT